MVALRDAGFSSPWKTLKELERPAFSDAANETKTRCEDLQAAVDATDSHVDLACGDPST